ncbi:unnamed protein product [Polarella glacialis]|uniref:Uncharacterized protein n=1 Tax=Polarella glacialis TaxID=89957 RepID=A0A813M3T5_POLGL|nr:unnamed protein product [Polarella glacialis]
MMKSASLAPPKPNMDYTPQSEEIFGVISQTKENFESNLNQTRQHEADDRTSYAGLKAAKEDDIAATQDTMGKKDAKLAAPDKKKADSMETLADTRDSLAADQKFFADVQARCASHGEEFAARTKTRNEEVTAVTKAVAILSDDSARDAFSRSFNKVASLIQVSSASSAHSKHKVSMRALTWESKLRTASKAASVLDHSSKQAAAQSRIEIAMLAAQHHGEQRALFATKQAFKQRAFQKNTFNQEAAL